MNKITILFFKSNSCENCRKTYEYISPLVNQNKDIIDLKIIDGFEDSTQDFCDEHNVDEMPHIKIYNEDDNLLYEKFGDAICLKNVSYIISEEVKKIRDK